MSTEELDKIRAELESLLEKITSNDPATTEVTIHGGVGGYPENFITKLVEALKTNTQVTTLVLTSAEIANIESKEIAELIKETKTITNLNLSSNKIGSDGFIALSEAIGVNNSLLELRLANQAGVAGSAAERAFAEGLDKNTSILKLGFDLREASARNTVNRALSRNQEAARKARQAAKKAAEGK
eukprot:TRINITY_DN8744_c0_g1_i1.p1 TRINITY_DN8744_c0_g1~~TRINITY_DN8744_c0_g1_i1.p1  ORF type:complete len:201 (-),score=51.98 TRINITY_DN8744_c0_g1_i1:49-603(-)